MGKDKIIITLGRHFGSGGNEIGKKLAKKLGIICYDKELMQMVSEHSGINESYFYMTDEKAGENILFKIMKNMAPKLEKPAIDKRLLNEDNLFLFQSDLISNLANQDSCIIIGRCADYVLRDRTDVLSVFITADKEARVVRLKEKYSKTEDEIEKMIKKTDKQRAEYYNYYTAKKWSDVDSYDVCLNSTTLGIDKTVDALYDFIQIWRNQED